MVSTAWSAHFFRNTKCKGCTAFVKVYPKGDGTETIISDETHAQACEALNGRKGQVHDASEDCSVVMHQFIEERYISEQHGTILPEKIWNDTMVHFRESLCSNFNGMTKNKAKSLVYNAWERSFEDDGIPKMEQLFSGSEDRAFLWDRLFVDKDGMQWMMCFSLPMLLALLKYPKVRLYYYFNHWFISTCYDNLCSLPSQGSNFCWLYLWHCPPSILLTLHRYGLNMACRIYIPFSRCKG